MPEYGGYDVKLGDFRLRLVRQGGKAPSLRYLNAPNEPGEAGGVGTIPFKDFHHGLRPDATDQPGGYRAISFAYTGEEGRVASSGLLAGVLIDGATNVGPTEVVGANGFKAVASSFNVGNDVYIVLPSKVAKITNGAATGATVFTPTASQFMRGPGAFYRGWWYFGLVSSAGVSLGFVRFQPSTGTWQEHFAAADEVKASMFHATSAGLWSVNVNSYGSPPGDMMWRLRFSDVSDPILDLGWQDMTTEDSSPVAVSLGSIGSELLVFGADGTVYAMVRGRGLIRAAKADVGDTLDQEFGLGAAIWEDTLLIPSTAELYALRGGSLATVSPRSITRGVKEEIRTGSAVGAFGDAMLVATRPELSGQHRLLMLRNYNDGLFYNQVEILWPSLTPRAISSLASGRSYVCNGDASIGRIDTIDLPPPAGGPPLSTGAGAASGSVASPYLSPGARAIVLQVRGWLESALSGSSTGRVRVSVDNAAPVDMTGVLTAAGPFLGTLARPVGRNISVILEPRASAPAGSGWPVFLGPVYLDYMEEPTAGRRMEFVVDGRARGGFARAGNQPFARMPLFEALKALQGTTQQFELLNTQSVFTALVERVEGADRSAGTGREPTYNSIRVTVVVL